MGPSMPPEIASIRGVSGGICQICNHLREEHLTQTRCKLQTFRKRYLILFPKLEEEVVLIS
jgi:hypothetical protein